MEGKLRERERKKESKVEKEEKRQRRKKKGKERRRRDNSPFPGERLSDRSSSVHEAPKQQPLSHNAMDARRREQDRWSIDRHVAYPPARQF
jgi:hypothetical protein